MQTYIKNFILSILLLLFTSCNSDNISLTPITQPQYNIAHDWIVLKDTQRNNAIVTAELFYPSIVAGEQAEIADEKFPLVIFAHGYNQEYGNYDYIKNTLVTRGYIVAFITTQQGITIDIDTYAKDISFLLEKLTTDDEEYDTILKGHITSKSALMGHSTGGGAIYLSQASIPKSTTIISLATLGKLYGPITGSSPIDIAKHITVPSLVLAGGKDCITPVAINQEPLYDNLNGSKIMAIIKDGDHCGFSDSTTCEMAELACSGIVQGITIDDNDQRELSSQLILSWLEHYLKENPEAWDSFVSLLNNDAVKYEVDLN